MRRVFRVTPLPQKQEINKRIYENMEEEEGF